MEICGLANFIPPLTWFSIGFRQSRFKKNSRSKRPNVLVSCIKLVFGQALETKKPPQWIEAVGIISLVRINAARAIAG